MNFRFTARSENRKTGPIPVTMSPQATCPSTCPLKGAGCYAESGPMSMAWRRLNGHEGMDWQAMLSHIRALPAGQLWRHNTAGDLPHVNGKLNARALQQLVEANAGRRGFTYTHHKLSAYNAAALRHANANGFVVNASTETLKQADAAMDQGLPAVVVLPSDAKDDLKTPAGRRVVVCPATKRTDVMCFNCRLCANASRDYVIGFHAHGTRRKMIDSNLSQGT